MANIGLVIDSTTEDAANIVLDLHDGVNFKTTALDLPTPPRDVAWASSVDTEGELPANLRYQNRQITITCWVFGTTQSALLTQLGYLQQKIGRCNARELPTLKYTAASGTVCVFDLLEGSADVSHDQEMVVTNRAQVTITFTAKPFWRSGLANETTSTDHAETTLPVVVGTDTAPGGDVPALGRLVIDDDEGQNQGTLIVGWQSRYYDSSADAALFYEAEGRTVQGGAATSVAMDSTGPSGSSPKTILQGTLTTSYQSMLSTQATGGGNHLRHIGTYRVFGRFRRPLSNTGAVSVRLSWAEGDFRRVTTNDDDGEDWAVDELEAAWTLVDLGLVRLTKVVAGTQRWEGRILAKSTVTGDDIYMDYLMLVPVDEGYGEIKIVPPAQIPTSFSARDEFDQTAGNLTGGKTTNNVSAITAANPGVLTVTTHGLVNGDLIWIEGITGTMGAVLNGYRTVAGSAASTFNVGVNTTGLTYVSGGTISKVGKALPVGGGWYGNSSAGSTNDFVMDTTNHVAQRTAVSDADINSGRFAFAAAVPLATTHVYATIKTSATPTGGSAHVFGVVARYIDPSNWVRAVVLETLSGRVSLQVTKRVAGTVTDLRIALERVASLTTGAIVDFYVYADGQYAAYLVYGGSVVGSVSGSDSDLATGGALASGVPGIYDGYAIATALTRSYDNFAVAGATADAAVFASQSIEIRHDRVVREDSTGTLWTPVSGYRGNYAKLPPARREGRSVRTIVKMSRGNIDTSPDVAIDDASFQWKFQTRGLVAPES